MDSELTDGAMRVLVINCGSATLKYKLFKESGAELERPRRRDPGD